MGGPGPFAYEERGDEAASAYEGLDIDNASNTIVAIDSDRVIVAPGTAEANRPKPKAAPAATEDPAAVVGGAGEQPQFGFSQGGGAPAGQLLKRFTGTIMISPERPARNMHQIIEAIVEHLTTMPGADVSLRLEIDAEVPSGLDRSKVRTLLENAATLGFLERKVEWPHKRQAIHLPVPRTGRRGIGMRQNAVCSASWELTT